MKDADEPVGEGTQGLVVSLAARFETVVVAPSARGSSQRRIGPQEGGIGQEPVARHPPTYQHIFARAFGHGRVAAVVLARFSIEVASRVVARLPQDPGAEDDTESWQTEKNLGVRVLFNRLPTAPPTEQDSGSQFRVNYVKPSGAIGYYYPDWVVVQRIGPAEDNWVVETKGRVWESTASKDAAMHHWCKQVAKLTGARWHYKRIDQEPFKRRRPRSFADLVTVEE